MVEKAKNMTIAEMVEQYDFIMSVLRIPERKQNNPLVMRGAEDPHPGKHQKDVDYMTEGYDYLFAELCKDHDDRKESVRNRRRADRNHPENKSERRKNKLCRMRKLYGDVWEDGLEWFYENGKTGLKKSTEKDAEIFRNLKERSAESDARTDYTTEMIERKVGKPTLQQRIDRIYAEMGRIADKFCADNDCHRGGRIAYTNNGGCGLYYPDEWYRLDAEVTELENYKRFLFQQKLDKGNKYLRKYVEE